MIEFEVIDNFLPTGEFERLQDVILSAEFPWFYIEHVSLDPIDDNIKDQFAVETDGYAHLFYEKETNLTAVTYKVLDDFNNQLENKLGIARDDILRSRASIKHPKIGYTIENYNLPHVDYFTPHLSLIYYVNDSDGDTRIFNEKFTPTPQGMNLGISYDTFTVKDTVEPKANRLLVINGLQYHTASNPIEHKRRVILNINTVVK